MIKAVLFDLFETLVTEANSKKVTSSRISKMLGIPTDEYKKLVSELRNCRYRGEYPDFRDVLNYAANKSGRGCDAELINTIAMEREECKAECFRNMPKEIIDMLTELKNRKLKLVLISNASCEEIKEFYNSEIRSYFDEVVFSCEVGFIKPEADIYNEACRRIGVEPHECIFVGDGGSNELIGAESLRIIAYRASWFTAIFGHAIPQDFPILSSPSELISVIDKCKVFELEN